MTWLGTRRWKLPLQGNWIMVKRAWILPAAAALLPQGVAAQGVIELEEAFVFSNLLPVEVNRTGASVEVVGAEDLEGSEQGVQNLLERLPGISVSSNGGLGSTAGVRIRGLNENYIGVTFDGIEVTDPSAPQNRFEFGQLTRGAIGRIEIAKGAQTAIYGSDAVAGAVNITSWRPDREGFSWGGEVEAGSYGTYSATLNLGRLDEDTEMAFTLSHIRSDGFSARVENDEPDGFEQTLLTFALEQDVTEAVALGGSLFYADEETEYDGFPATDPVGLSDGIRKGARVFARVRGERVEHEVSLSYYDRFRNEISSFGPFPFEGERTKLAYLGRTELGPATGLAFGADWTEERAVVGASSYDAANGAVFGEVNHALSEVTDIALSLRHDVYSDFADQTSARVALVHRAANDLTIRASIGNGYRAPSLFERFDGFSGNPALTPETGLGGEVSVEKGFEGGWLKATVFRTDIEDLIDFDFGTFTYMQTTGTTRTQGAELSGEWALGAATVYGSYTYTDAERAGMRLDRVPRHDLTLGLMAPVTERLDAALDVRAVGDVLDGGMPLDDYAVANASLTYAVTEDVDAWLRIENLFDEDYETVRFYNTPGRSFYVGLRAAF